MTLCGQYSIDRMDRLLWHRSVASGTLVYQHLLLYLLPLFHSLSLSLSAVISPSIILFLLTDL